MNARDYRAVRAALKSLHEASQAIQAAENWLAPIEWETRAIAGQLKQQRYAILKEALALRTSPAFVAAERDYCLHVLRPLGPGRYECEALRPDRRLERRPDRLARLRKSHDFRHSQLPTPPGKETTTC